MEHQENIPKKQRSAIISLLAFSAVAFAMCFVAIFAITLWHRNYLLTQRIHQTPPGYFINNTYVNEQLGWQISFPENFNTYTSEQIRNWQHLSLMPGFEQAGRRQLQLFLVAGEYFSTLALAQKDILTSREALLDPLLLIERRHEQLKSSIREQSKHSVRFEPFNEVVNGISFRGLAIEYSNGPEPTKWQRVYTTVLDDYMLHYALVFQDMDHGNALGEAFFNSRFQNQ